MTDTEIVQSTKHSTKVQSERPKLPLKLSLSKLRKRLKISETNFEILYYSPYSYFFLVNFAYNYLFILACKLLTHPVQYHKIDFLNISANYWGCFGADVIPHFVQFLGPTLKTNKIHASLVSLLFTKGSCQ